MMEPKHREVLRAHRLQLSQQLLVDDTVIQYLYQEDILTESQVEDIQAQTSNRNKALKLLHILPTRGPNAFDVFLKSLEQDFPWIKEKMMVLLEDGSSALSDSAQWTIPQHLLHTVPSHQQLNKLASCLGSEWETVLMDLEMLPEQLYRCRADHPLSVRDQVLAGLVMWKQVQGRKATVERLLQSLQVAEVHPSVLSQVFM